MTIVKVLDAVVTNNARVYGNVSFQLVTAAAKKGAKENLNEHKSYTLIAKRAFGPFKMIYLLMVTFQLIIFRSCDGAVVLSQQPESY